MKRQQLPRSTHYFGMAILVMTAMSMPVQADILTDECPPAGSTAIPTGIAVPAGNRRSLTLSAAGVQVYTCTATPTATTPFTWVNTAKADLFKEGRKVGSHYFSPGPTWKIKESEVKGTRVCAVPSPVESPVGAPAAASITWVLLSATPPTQGAFKEVTYIQRVNTIAGTRAPDYACDETHKGDVLTKPYAANYLFYKNKH